MKRDESPGDDHVSPAQFIFPKGPVAAQDQGASNTGRNLLFGLLALQNSFIDRDALVAAFGAWVADKSKSLGAILLDRGTLDGPRHALLEALVAEHLKLHGGDPERSLAALAVGGSTRESLQRVGDAGLEASLSHAGAATAADGADTVIPYAVEMSTAQGRRFRVLRPHAQGGLGAVFVALDSELNREVALKEILDRHADDLVNRARFLMEAEITGRLEHPGIVPVYGLGTYADGRPYYAMRFVRGDSLKEAIAAFHADTGLKAEPGRQSLELRKLLRRFLDVCNAIDYAHSRGVLHRDIKPGNVIVGKYGETLVVDWGLAKPIGHREPRMPSDERTLWPSSARGSAETLPGTALGTPAYMSPEQAAGEIDRLGPRSDVYSLGATLYSLLTGRPPFGGAPVDEILRMVTKGAFPPPRQIDPALNRALEAICLKAMALKPEDRYATPRALADDVERWIADEPVTALPESTGSRLARWSRRNRAWVRAGAAALVVVLITTGAFAVQQTRSAARERQARNREHQAAARERQAHAVAQTRLGQVEKANDLLADIFEDIDPRDSAKEGQSLGEILGDRLEQAAAQLDGAQIGDPLTVAKLQIALGKSLLHLGYPAKALPLFERARKTRADQLGRDDAGTLDASSHLAEASLELGRFAEALALVEETLKLQTATLGPIHHEVFQSREILGILYGRLGRFAEAIALQEETLKLRPQKDGPDDPDTLTSRNNLGHLYARVGRFAEAIAVHEETLKRRAARLGPDHPDTLNSRSNLAQAYARVGKLTEALKLDEGTLALRTGKLGANHPNTLHTRGDLALAYSRAGRRAEAIGLQEETIKLSTARLGPDHPDTLLYRSNLATLLFWGGRLVEAIPVLEDVLKLDTAKLGRDNPETLRSRANLATLYAEAGRFAEAIKLNKEALELRESKLGPDHIDTLTNRNNLASLYEQLESWSSAEPLRRENVALRRKSGQPGTPILAGDLAALGSNLLNQSKWAEAQAVLRECLAIREKAIPADWSTFNTMSQLGGALFGQGEFAEAEPLIVEGYSGMKAREQAIPPVGRPRLPEAAERVVRLYERWGKPERVVEWKAKLGLGELPSHVFAPR